jgi:catechol 2,3-dioxygenase-like lactoylglutathione lyase family enzyme
MLKDCAPIAFVATRQPTEARRFYQEVLGLQFVADEPFALVFSANGVMLRIAKMADFTPVPQTVLGWHVADIQAMMKGLAAKGIYFQRYEGLPQDELGIWKTPNGAQIAWFKDPDGNTLSLTQFAA